MHVVRCKSLLRPRHHVKLLSAFIANKRFYHKHNCTAITYKEYGNPETVLQSEIAPLPHINSDSVLVRMLAAPVNPADINMIQGVYPIKPRLPAVAGNEGVGEIVEVGANVSSLQPGDVVIPVSAACGTWRTELVCEEKDVISIDKTIPLFSAATIAVNPCTAYRMLKDFAHLAPGDVVIQNGANSAVGQAVIQISKTLFGLKTVNIVRKREETSETDKVVNMLMDLGATHVLTDEFLRSKEMKEFMKTIPPPKLALNCVGGKAVADIAKYLEQGATIVTYGGMSKQPLLVPAGPLIFKDVSFRGFWMTKWNEKHIHHEDRTKMLEALISMIHQNQLSPPLVNPVPLSNFRTAIRSAMEGFTAHKQVLLLQETREH